MKKGFTLVETLVTVVILAVLAAIALPMFGKSIRRARLKEVKSMVELTRAAAKYYDFKYGIETLRADTMPQDDVWEALKVDRPLQAQGAECTYTITRIDEMAPNILKVYNKDGTPIYTYQLPDGPGALPDTTDKVYLTDLPL